MSDTLHSRKCLAQALISAVENFRDEQGMTDFDFRILAQENRFLVAADDYLATGLQTCTCHVAAFASIKERYVTEGVAAAQSLAEAHLKNKTISPEQYVWIARVGLDNI